MPNLSTTASELRRHGLCSISLLPPNCHRWPPTTFILHSDLLFTASWVTSSTILQCLRPWLISIAWLWSVSQTHCTDTLSWFSSISSQGTEKSWIFKGLVQLVEAPLYTVSVKSKQRRMVPRSCMGECACGSSEDNIWDPQYWRELFITGHMGTCSL